MGMGRWLSGLCIGAVVAACSLTDSKNHAGESCQKASDCDSNDCRSSTCAGKTCGTSSPDPSQCESGWQCQHFDTSCALVNVLCSDAEYRCIITCGAGCPAGMYCPAGNTDPSTECEYGKAPDREPPPQPTLSFVNVPRFAHPGDAVPFSVNIVFTADESIASTTWDFGDGTTGTGQNPMHAYANLGTYNYKVAVTDNYHRTSNAAGSIYTCNDKGGTCTTSDDCCNTPDVKCNAGICADAF